MLTLRKKGDDMQSIQLVGDQRLIVERAESGDSIYLIGPGGRMSITIEVTKEGPILRFDTPGLVIETTGQLGINAERISIHARRELDLSCDGNASVKIAGNLETSARIQTIRAELGNVDVKANDDVRLVGEHILLNC